MLNVTTKNSGYSGDQRVRYYQVVITDDLLRRTEAPSQKTTFDDGQERAK